MKHIQWKLFPVAALLVVSQPIWAVTPAGSGMATGRPIANTHGTVARGGTITAVNHENRMISVDGVSYHLSFGSIVVHSDDPSVPGNIFNLKQGMRIRFNTVRDTGGQNKVSEIWVTKPDGNAMQKNQSHEFDLHR